VSFDPTDVSKCLSNCLIRALVSLQFDDEVARLGFMLGEDVDKADVSRKLISSFRCLGSAGIGIPGAGR
jgi:hypothetical protein